MSRDFDSADIIDDQDHPEKVILYSKLSIFLLGLFLSPLWASFLYAANLRNVGQQRKILALIFSVLICQAMIFLPLNGFDVGIDLMYLIRLGSRFLVMMIFLFPVWSQHFGGILHNSIFPWYRVTLIVSVYLLLNLIQYFYNVPILRFVV